jgi:DNA-binding transcriptional MerR regulator
MGNYSIKELEKLSGIKAHTIRIWEKRYNLVEPNRTATNIRYYSDDDLKKIINVSVLNTHGVKISKIADLSSDQLCQKVSELSESKNDIEIHINQLVVSMVDMDEEAFEKLLSELTGRYGFENTIIQIVYPFLEKIGILWLTNNISPGQEHFISHLIRQKIIVAIDALPRAPKSAKSAMLYLPENELHELGLLFFTYIAKKAGFRIFYLGQSVPYKDLKIVFEQHHPDILISAFTGTPQPKALPGYVQNLSQDFGKSKILLTGHLIKTAKIELPANIQVFANSMILKQLLEDIK